jgi:hypothetical protein
MPRWRPRRSGAIRDCSMSRTCGFPVYFILWLGPGPLMRVRLGRACRRLRHVFTTCRARLTTAQNASRACQKASKGSFRYAKSNPAFTANSTRVRNSSITVQPPGGPGPNVGPFLLPADMRRVARIPRAYPPLQASCAAHTDGRRGQKCATKSPVEPGLREVDRGRVSRRYQSSCGPSGALAGGLAARPG